MQGLPEGVEVLAPEKCSLTSSPRGAVFLEWISILTVGGRAVCLPWLGDAQGI